MAKRENLTEQESGFVESELAKFGNIPVDYSVKKTAKNELVLTIIPKPDKFTTLFHRLGLLGDRRSISKKERQVVFDKTYGKCFYCGCDLIGNWHVDHFKPFSVGGTDFIDNLVPSCRKCNILKSANLPSDKDRLRLEKLNA